MITISNLDECNLCYTSAPSYYLLYKWPDTVFSEPTALYIAGYCHWHYNERVAGELKHGIKILIKDLTKEQALKYQVML